MQDIPNSKLICDATVELLDRMANDPQLLVALHRGGRPFLEGCGLPSGAQALIDGSASNRSTPFVGAPSISPTPWIAAPFVAAPNSIRPPWIISAPYIAAPYVAAPFKATM